MDANREAFLKRIKKSLQCNDQMLNKDTELEEMERLLKRMCGTTLDLVAMLNSVLAEYKNYEKRQKEMNFGAEIKALDDEIDHLKKQVDEKILHLEKLYAEYWELKFITVKDDEAVKFFTEFSVQYYPDRAQEIAENLIFARMMWNDFDEKEEESSEVGELLKEVEKFAAENTELNKQLEDLRKDEEKIKLLENEGAKYDQDLRALAEKSEKLAQEKKDLQQEVANLSKTLEQLKQKKQTKTVEPETEDETYDLSELFKDPNDFPNLLDLLDKSANNTPPKVKTTPKKKNKHVTFDSSDHGKKRRMIPSPKNSKRQLPTRSVKDRSKLSPKHLSSTSSNKTLSPLVDQPQINTEKPPTNTIVVTPAQITKQPSLVPPTEKTVEVPKATKSASATQSPKQSKESDVGAISEKAPEGNIDRAMSSADEVNSIEDLFNASFNLSPEKSNEGPNSSFSLNSPVAFSNSGDGQLNFSLGSFGSDENNGAAPNFNFGTGFNFSGNDNAANNDEGNFFF